MVGFKATDVPPTATVKFLGAGTAACIADLITFPLDTAKVRLQVRRCSLLIPVVSGLLLAQDRLPRGPKLAFGDAKLEVALKGG